MTDSKPKSKYVIVREADSFSVMAEDRNTVTARITRDHKWQVLWDGPSEWLSWSKDPCRHDRNADILDFPALLHWIAAGLMYEWTPQEYPDRVTWFGVKKWAIGQTKKALNHRILAERNVLLEKTYSEKELKLLRRIFSVCYRTPPPETLKALLTFDDDLLISDIMNYRAACHASVMWESTRAFRFAPFDNHNWMKAFACWDEDINRPLRRTLMNLPHAIPNRLLYVYQYHAPPRAVFTKRELCFILSYIRVGRIDRALPDWLYKVTDEMVLDMCKLHTKSEYSGEPLRVLMPNRWKYIESVARHIYDSVRMDRGRIWTAKTAYSALKRARELHREEHRNELEREARYEARRLKRLGVKNKTLVDVPPIALPDDERIKFLSTVGAIRQEGAEMGHCISGYAGDACAGEYYIFRVEYKGERATTAITGYGDFYDTQGPRNSQNKATQYSRRVLGRWANKLKSYLEEQKKEHSIATQPTTNLHDYIGLPY